MTAGLGAGMGLTFLLAAYLVMPRFDALKSARHLSQVLVEHAPAGTPYGIYPRLDPAFLFYTHRFAENLDGPWELHAFVDRPGPVWLLIQRDEIAKLKDPLPPMREVARDGDPKEGYLLLTRE